MQRVVVGGAVELAAIPEYSSVFVGGFHCDNGLFFAGGIGAPCQACQGSHVSQLYFVSSRFSIGTPVVQVNKGRLGVKEENRTYESISETTNFFLNNLNHDRYS